MKRQYLGGGIGLENTYQQYIDNLLAIIEEVYRVLKPTGSFWLNIGDSLTPLTPVALTTAPFSTCALRGFFLTESES